MLVSSVNLSDSQLFEFCAIPEPFQVPQLLNTAQLSEKLRQIQQTSPSQQFQQLAAFLQQIQSFKKQLDISFYKLNAQIQSQNAQMQSLQHTFEQVQSVLSQIPPFDLNILSDLQNNIQKLQQSQFSAQNLHQQVFTKHESLINEQMQLQKLKEKLKTELKMKQKKLKDGIELGKQDGELKVLLKQAVELENAKNKLDSDIQNLKDVLTEMGKL
ncbi:Hypothetical_protein [Hexamita inflata]|uniref:Hypothetical_protein n=1 Tax=Hexamita inflata TaxID=28002 RepID=A0AA86QPN8_9EUKA|nr:Hypothetical protein HINF_LOCUS43345 [Hexamita inflata]